MEEVGVNRGRCRNSRHAAAVALVMSIVASLLTACSSPVTLPHAEFQGKQRVAGTGLTTVSLGEGGAAVIPTGSAAAGSTVNVSSSHPPGPWPSDLKSLRSPVHLELSSGNLTGPALISFAYDPSTVPAGIAPSDFFGISTYDEASDTWLVVPSTVDVSRHVIVADITHFSWWNPFTWDFDKLSSEVSQDALQTVGIRSAAPVCSGPAYPSYISSVDTLLDASDPLRSCSDVNSGVLEVKMTSNRSYGMIMTYRTKVKWGWHASGGSILDKALDSVIDQGLPSNELYIPSLQAASIGIPDSPFGFVTYSARPTLATMVANIADLVIPSIPGDGTVAGEAAASCRSLLLTFDTPSSISVALSDVNSIAQCLTDGIEAAIKTGKLSASDISKLTKSKATLLILKNLKKLGTDVSIGVTLGTTIGDLVMGKYFDNGLRQFSVRHKFVASANSTTTTTTIIAPTATTTTTTTPASSGSLTVGSPFSDDCVVAWPTAPTVTSDSIIMTMTCGHVPEGEFLFTQVQYGNPNLDVTPSTGTMHVVGRVVDVAKSDYGYEELVVRASSITFG
jgi:hypothetical protein